MPGIFVDFDKKYKHADDAIINRMVLTSVAVVLLMCASVLLFFAYIKLPISVSTGLTLLSLFIGSLLSWKSGAIAQSVLILSLLVTEFVILSYNMDFLIAFIIFDIIAILFLPRNFDE